MQLSTYLCLHVGISVLILDAVQASQRHFHIDKVFSLKPDKREISKATRQGSFKIDDGDVIGAGIYEIRPDGVVDISLKLRISSSKQPCGQPCAPSTALAKPSPGVSPTPAPGGTTPAAAPGGGGSETTTAPGGGGSETTTAPGGGGSETTAAPGGGGSETTAAPGGGGSETTAAPGGGGSETTAAPGGGGSETTVAPGGGGSETTAAPGGGGSETTAAPGGGDSKTTAAPGGGGSDFENEALEAHNKLRKVHGVPMMKLNAEMSKQAQAWADKIAADGDGSHDPSISGKFGENWNIGCQEDQKSATATVTRWYNEVCDPGYTFGGEPSSLNAGHFTQVVWKSSVELGYGKKEGTYMGAKCMFHVGRYKEAGNYGGKYTENVPEGSFNKQSYCDSIKKKSKRKRYEMPHIFKRKLV